MFTGLEAVRANPARRWITMVSFSLQAMLVGAALIFPLVRPASLPDMKRLIFRPLSAGVEHPQATHSTHNAMSRTAPMLPPLVVRTVPTLRTTYVGTTASNVTGPPNMVILGDSRTDIRGLMLDSNSRPAPQPAYIATHNAPVSVMMEGNLLPQD